MSGPNGIADDWPFAAPPPPSDPATLAALREAEAEASDPRGTSMRFALATPEERERNLRLAAQWQESRAKEIAHVKATVAPELWHIYLDPDELDASPAWRTLADVPDDAPRPLRFGMLEPDGPTMAYGAPGVGKGTTGAWLTVEAQRAGMLPCVYDAERRPREWSRRVAGLGGDRSRVVYLEPPDLGPKLAGRPLWEVAPAIGKVCQAAGADLLLVDSIMPSVGLGEERLRSDAQVPYLYVAALDALGIPSISFGHPPKGQPEGEPFGSFAWVAAMRLTWLGTRAEGDGHRVRWRRKKSNERGHVPGILLSFDYGEDGRPCSVSREDDDESTRDWILAALVHGPRGVSDMAEDLLGELDDPAPGEDERVRGRLSRTLQRMRREGWVNKQGKAGRGVQWTLNLAEKPR